MGPAGAGRRDGPAVRGDLVETAAQHEEGVGLEQSRMDGGRGEVAAHPQVERVVVGEDVGAPPGRHHRDVRHLGESDEVGRGARAQDPGPGEDHRPLRVEEEVEDAPDGGRVRLRRARRAQHRGGCHAPPVDGRGLVEEILGEAQQDGTRTTGRRPAERLIEGSGEPRDVPDLAGPAAEAAEDRHQVGLLECLPTAGGPVDLPGDRDERHGVGMRGVEGDGEVRRPDRPCHDDGRRAARQGAVGGRHEPGSSLVASRHDPDSGRGQPVEERQEAFAGHGEGDPHTRGGERVGDEAPRSSLGSAHLSSPPGAGTTSPRAP